MPLSRLLLALVFVFPHFVHAQSTAVIQKQLQKLNSFQKVLYVAAHPDDENTRVIAWLSQGRNAHVRYLSLTRGDGGQNMIGTELGPELGILRTQELLAARSIDGGTQAFSRAVDFGYSKSADETLEKWDEQTVLGDVVRAIRSFQPDVIITRFPPDARGGHGHHTASAMLAIEAFELAASESAFPEQLEDLSPWETSSIYWNTYSWRWDPNLDSLVENDPAYIKSDIGGFDPILGVSYNELGSLARSQHRCQGFGVSIMRGETFEYFQHLKGAQVNSDLLENTSRSWTNVGGTSKMDKLANQLMSNFEPSAPQKSLPLLLQLREIISFSSMESEWKTMKLKQVDELIAACSGLFVEAVTPAYSVGPGETVKVDLKAIARSVDGIQLASLNVGPTSLSFEEEVSLPRNQFYEMDVEVEVPQEISQPYWLVEPFTASYVVKDAQLIGTPENASLLEAECNFILDGKSFTAVVPVTYKWSDRVDGEQRRPFVVTPKATATFDDDVVIFADENSKEVRLRVKSFEDEFSTTVSLVVPEGWTVTPTSTELQFESKYQEQVVSFRVSAPSGSSVGDITPELTGVSNPVQRFSEVAYPHIPTQVVFGHSSVRVVKLDCQINAGKVAYIQGAGDEVDMAIEQLGFEVVRMTEADLAARSSLNEFKAVVVGIRAYNVHPWLLNYREKLMQYVHDGGHLIVQYNTATRDLLTNNFGPYPLTLSRNRVTEEDADVKLLKPNHPFFTTPNQISTSDFDGWVQERGLYYASEWSDEYEPLIAWHDRGEEDQLGGLLVAEYGKGTFTYTGISFFRELPAGVPGAFRLLANLLSHE